MDQIISRGIDSDVDLESGVTTSEEDEIKGLNSNIIHANKLLGRAWSGVTGFDKPIRGREGSGPNNKVLNSGDLLVENVGDLLVENVDMMSNKLGPAMLNTADKEIARDKRKKRSSKIPSKPPRPPRGPSLDAADVKFVREFSELAALKRKRTERMMSSRKMKAEKTSSVNSNLCAMLVTILFCLVIVFQGLLGSRV